MQHHGQYLCILLFKEHGSHSIPSLGKRMKWLTTTESHLLRSRLVSWNSSDIVSCYLLYDDTPCGSCLKKLISYFNTQWIRLIVNSNCYMEGAWVVWFLSFQVSHHPPMSAAHAENEHFTYDITSKLKTKFLGNSVEVYPVGRWACLSQNLILNGNDNSIS